MKVLIWIGCLFANALITTLFKENGIILGAIPTVLLYLGAVYLARTLCKLWDERNVKNNAQKNTEAFQKSSGFCKECGHRLVSEGKFCNKCGAETTENHLNNGKFCIICGTNITYDNDNCHVCFAKIESKEQ